MYKYFYAWFPQGMDIRETLNCMTLTVGIAITKQAHH